MDAVNPLPAKIHPAAVAAGLRQAGADELARSLHASRQDTLATFAVYQQALPGLAVPHADEFNPPCWELGHLDWFAQHWLTRNPERRRGVQADPHAPRAPARQRNSDALFDSSAVPHATRWQLPLPGPAVLHPVLAEGLQQTLALLADSAPDDTGLYFHRLVLAHEDMHHEAALYMAQALGLPVTDARWQPRPLAGAREALAFDGAEVTLGWRGPGFAFDNELGVHRVRLQPYGIDSRVVTWGEYLPFVNASGYTQPQWWSEAGLAWLALGHRGPRYLSGSGRNNPDRAAWQQQRWGRWQALDPAEPACHLSAFEAEAWCAWAGRRLPTEAEWEHAATQAGPGFRWGAVWEWTASDFAPYPGFDPHPYREYSAPWFGSRRVLRGASFCTQPRLHDVHYRNYFLPGRNDIFAGFRSCAR